MQTQCFTIHNKRPCRKSVDYVLRLGAVNAQSRVFCNYKCFTTTYKENPYFRAAMDSEQGVFVIYLEITESGAIVLRNAHPLNWYVYQYPNFKWDLWNGVAVDEIARQIVLEDKDTCLCIAGIALTCKVPDGCHWGQPGYKGGSK